MITITVQPSTPDQFAAVGRLLSDYSKAMPADVSAADDETAAVETPAAPPVRRARKSAAAAPVVGAAEQNEAPVVEEAPAPVTPPAPPAPVAVTLEQVRARLAQLSQAGKTAEIKALLSKFGAAKLTDLSSEKFADLLTAAEAL